MKFLVSVVGIREQKGLECRECYRRGGVVFMSHQWSSDRVGKNA